MNTCTFCGCDGHIQSTCQRKKQCACPEYHRFRCSKCNWCLLKSLPYIPVDQRSQENRQLDIKERLIRRISFFEEAGDCQRVNALKKKLATFP
jgi:hypothetical protein